MSVRLVLARLLLLVAVLLPMRASAQTDVIEYYGVDALGSVRVVFDSAGNLINRMDYGPFGEQLAPSGFGRRVYAQLFRDGETGLDYAEARMYQSRTGRFNAPDAVYAGLFHPQAWNRYNYALNNSLSFVDPDGLNAQACAGHSSYTEQTVDSDKPVPIRMGITCDGGGGGGISAQMFFFLSGINFQQRGAGSGRVDEPGGGKGRTRGSTIPTTSTTPTTETPTNPTPTGGCNPVTLEGCSPNPVVATTQAFVAGTRDALKAIWATPSESCLVLFGKEVWKNLDPFSPSPEALAGPIAGGWAYVEHNRAMAYAASRPNYLGFTGLLYPRKSSVYRSMIATRDAVLSKGSVALSANLSIWPAVVTEARAGLAGQCR